MHASGTIGEGQFPKPVGDPQRRDRVDGVFAKPLHGGQHRCLAAGIEQGGRFIEQQEPGVTRQGSGNRQALFLAAAEAVNRPLLQLGMDPEGPQQHRQSTVRGLLNQLGGLAQLEKRPIHSLSGGQKQRLAIAGALASDAGLLLLDEPTALLDPESQTTVLSTVQRLCKDPVKPITALWITHRLGELAFADGAARMQGGRIGPWTRGTELQRRLQGGTFEG